MNDTERLIIDEMRTEDIVQVRALWQSVPELGVNLSFDSEERVAAYLQRNPSFSTVARDGGRVVGAVLCGHDGRRGSLYHMAVLPAYQRRGIATRMVERSISQLREADLHTAFVFTHAGRPDAQAFWRGTNWAYSPHVEYHYREF